MPSSPQPTVFIVDDDDDARESVIALVRSKGGAARGFNSAEDFLDHYGTHHTGCLVVDVRLTGMSGLELLEVLKKRGIVLPVIIITGFADVPTAVRAMRSGAYSFLEKPPPQNELWDCITSALDLNVSQQQSRQVKEEIAARLAALTSDEIDVLKHLMRGEPNKKIAAELDIGLRTVELRRATVLKKMQAESLAELVRVAIAAGFPFE